MTNMHENKTIVSERWFYCTFLTMYINYINLLGIVK